MSQTDSLIACSLDNIFYTAPCRGGTMLPVCPSVCVCGPGCGAVCGNWVKHGDRGEVAAGPGSDVSVGRRRGGKSRPLRLHQAASNAHVSVLVCIYIYIHIYI